MTHLYPNRLVVDLAGQVGTIEKALGVQINNYRLGAKTFFANNHDPVLPKSLSGIVESVEGLSSLQTMFPASPTAARAGEPGVRRRVPSPPSARTRRPTAAARSCARRSGPPRLNGGAAKGAKVHITNGAYDPTDIYSSQAYDYNALYDQGHCCNPLGNPGNSPAQTSIAIATFGSQQISDIAGFHAQYPYLAYNIQEVFIDGTPSCCDAEGTMDMEWSTAMSNSFGSFQNTVQGVPVRRGQLQRLHVHRHVQPDGHRQRGPGVQHELELHRALRLQLDRDEQHGTPSSARWPARAGPWSPRPATGAPTTTARTWRSASRRRTRTWSAPAGPS